MTIVFARLLQFSAGIGFLFLSSLGVSVKNDIALERKGLGAVQAIDIAQQAADLICGDKTFLPEFLACGSEIGRSVENRPIYVFNAGKNRVIKNDPIAESGHPAKVLLIGGLHTGTEKNTFDLAVKVLRYYYGHPESVPENIALYIIPKANPDGIAHGMHNNARGVDLNRNWPTDDWRSDPYHPVYSRREGAGGNAPLSEPETLALYNFIQKERPMLALTWHSQAGSVHGNGIGIAGEAAKIYAKAANYQYIEEWTHYETTGTFLQAMQDVATPAIDVELLSRKTEFNRNINGVNALLDFIFPQF